MVETEPVCALEIAQRIVAEKTAHPDSGEPDTRWGMMLAALTCQRSGQNCQVLADLVDGKYRNIRVVTEGQCERID